MENSRNKIQELAIFVLVLSMYSIFTISSITESWTVTIVLLFISIALLMFSTMSSKLDVGIEHMVGIEQMVGLVFSLLCLFGVIKGSSIRFFVFYFLYFILLIISNNMNTISYFKMLQYFRVFGFVFSASCYLQYLFPDQYYAYLFPLFGSEYQRSIRRQFYFHDMCTGLTSQTFATAGFIILGLISAIYVFQLDKSQKVVQSKRYAVFLLEIVFLVGGLLLTGKRSPIVNFGCAYIVVDMISTKKNKKVTRFLGDLLGIFFVIFILYMIASVFLDSRNSIVRILEYVNIAKNGGDITNGRLELYANAIKEFEKNPIFGIGWGRYSILYETSGAHNIYLQLLCECGIIGFLVTLVCMGAALRKCILQLKKAMHTNNQYIITICRMSLFLQMYILVYGMFGNPIYDQNYLIVYIIGLMLSVSVNKEIKDSFAYA